MTTIRRFLGGTPHLVFFFLRRIKGLSPLALPQNQKYHLIRSSLLFTRHHISNSLLFFVFFTSNTFKMKVTLAFLAASVAPFLATTLAAPVDAVCINNGLMSYLRGICLCSQFLLSFYYRRKSKLPTSTTTARATTGTMTARNTNTTQRTIVTPTRTKPPRKTMLRLRRVSNLLRQSSFLAFQC